jgi:hypothetical protein
MGQLLKDIIAGLEHQELLKMKKDLEEGSLHIRKLVNKQIREHEKRHQMNCATCLSDLNQYSRSNYTLLFGPDDFKKKASFCGLDCLEYFLNNLKELEKKR